MKNYSIPSLLLVFLLTACHSGKRYELSHTFENSTWDRFNKLQFEMPANIKPGDYDITLIIRLNESFEYDRFPVFVTLNTPSGEERTNEIELKIKDNGRFNQTPENGLVTITQKLWEGIHLADTGVCMITVENLIPKIQAFGVNGVSMVMQREK